MEKGVPREVTKQLYQRAERGAALGALRASSRFSAGVCAEVDRKCVACYRLGRQGWALSKRRNREPRLPRLVGGVDPGNSVRLLA